MNRPEFYPEYAEFEDQRWLSDPREFAYGQMAQRMEMLQSGRKGTCYQENFMLYIEKCKDYYEIMNKVKHQKNFNYVMSYLHKYDVELLDVQLKCGINHCVISYTASDGKKFIEDRSNFIWKKVEYVKWCKMNRVRKITKLPIRCHFERTTANFSCPLPVNMNVTISDE
mgnify:CR=1 FL=1|jgi:hypothetical protein|tara:strand:+ start:530 stop:1036 length:507 start_codon:yes stop_codon:yes gene_type:complete